MEKLLSSKDFMDIFGCRKDKALALMREMNPIDITLKPGTKKRNLRVRESDLNAWIAANRGRVVNPSPEEEKPASRMGRKPRPVYLPPAPAPCNGHIIPRRHSGKTEKAKAPGDAATSIQGQASNTMSIIAQQQKEAQVHNA